MVNRTTRVSSDGIQMRGTADRGHDQTLAGELSENAEWPRAQSCAKRDLAPTVLAPGEQKDRDVRTGDEQDDKH